MAIVFRSNLKLNVIPATSPGEPVLSRIGASGLLGINNSIGGDVIGPLSSTDNALVRFDGTTGKLLQNSVITVSDTGVISINGSTGISGQVLTSAGAGSPPTWQTPSSVADGDKGDITVTSSGAVWTIDNNVVTYAKLQDVSTTNRFLGRISGGAGDAEELTGTQATTLLDVFTSGLKGLAPASGGGTTNFLRADGTWAVPSGGITNSALNTELMMSNGTNAISSGLFSTLSAGNRTLTIGSAAVSGNHIITTSNTGATASLAINPQGVLTIKTGWSFSSSTQLTNNSGSSSFITSTTDISIQGRTTTIGALTIASGTSGVTSVIGNDASGTTTGNVNVNILGGNSSIAGVAAGNVVINAGFNSNTSIRGNVVIGEGSIASFQNMQNGIAIPNIVVEPSAAIANSVAVYSVDNAASTILGLRCETAVATDVGLTATNSLLVKINGTVYKILLST